MKNLSSIETQVASLHIGIENFASCVASLDDKLFQAKLGSWTPRDIVAHLIGWNRYIITGSKQIIKGELPFYDIDPGENYCKVNANLIEEYPSEDRSQLIHELEVSGQELKQFLQTLDPSKWCHDYGVRHKGEVITIQNTVDALIEDYAHHSQQIKQWMES